MGGAVPDFFSPVVRDLRAEVDMLKQQVLDLTTWARDLGDWAGLYTSPYAGLGWQRPPELKLPKDKIP